MAAGIRTRHGANCATRDGRRCNCKPSYEAWAYTKRDDKKIRRTFKSFAEAKAWRVDAERAIRTRSLRAPTRVSFGEVAREWLEKAERGEIENRSGDRYKPSSLRGYREALELRVLPEIGGARLVSIERRDLQGLVNRLKACCSPSTVRNTIMPVRTIYRYALDVHGLEVNPTAGLKLPTVRGGRDRIAEPVEGDTLLAALPEADRPVWATAMYAGLRRGELLALDWSSVDLERNMIHVEASWDRKAGKVPPKSEKGRRTVPIPRDLREHLIAHRLRQGRGGEGLVFGRTTEMPFNPNTIRRRAEAAWKDAGLEPIGLHECRHTYASLMIAAGNNAKAIATFMGHSSVTITYDRYGHLMPGGEEEAADRLDAYLAKRRAVI